jgi:hypothetical protein
MKLFLSLATLPSVFCELAGWKQNWANGRCERCLARSYDYCGITEYILDDNGQCCRNLEYAGQYCDADEPYCTQSFI